MKIITKAIELIEGKVSYDFKYSPIYMFSTENTKCVIKGLKVKGKKVLTPSSSCDHIFEMLFNDVLSVEVFDINYFTKCYFYFKEAAIRSLTYNEFMNFFFNKPFSFNKKAFSNKVFFEKILPNIKDEEAKEFWNTLFKKYSGKVLYNSKLFYNKRYNINIYKECNSYLKNETNFKKLQEKLENFKYNFYNLNILEDSSVLENNKYDIIYLSNILDYIPDCKDEISLLNKIKTIILNLKKYLTSEGTLGLCYLYFYRDTDLSSTPSPAISDMYFRRKYLSTICKYISFSGIENPKSSLGINKDALMLVRNKGK